MKIFPFLKFFLEYLILFGFIAHFLFFKETFAVFNTDVRKTEPFPYVMSDWANGDWNNPNYYIRYFDPQTQSWQEETGHPEWGPVGGWWDDGPPNDASQTCFPWGDLWFAQFENYYNKCKDCKVLLDDGQQISKPVGFAVGFPNYSKEQLPQIENFVKELAKKYDNDPRLSFLILCSCNNYGEFTDSNPYPCNVKGIAEEVVPLFRKHLKKLPTFVQCTTWNCGIFASNYANDEYSNKNAGVKCNGWRPERDDAFVYVNDQLYGGCYGFAHKYHDKIPVGFEPAGGGNLCEIYWLIMEGLSLHADFFDIQRPILKNAARYESTYGFPLLRFAREHLQRTINNAPDVWTILKQTTIKEICWQGTCQGYRCVPCEYGEAPDPNCSQEGKRCSAPRICYKDSKGEEICTGPWKGNLNYWLYAREDLPQSKPVVLFSTHNPKSPCSWTINELPFPANSHSYSRFSVKRTDEASGNIFMSFDIDDRYQPPPNTNSWEITLTFVNKGSDSLSLEYPNKNGQTIKKTIKKGESLGEVNNWVDYKWILTDADFSGNKLNGVDFRINCENDGDEIIHRVIARPVYVFFSPTPTISPSPVLTPPQSLTINPSPSPTLPSSLDLIFFQGWNRVKLGFKAQIPSECGIATYKQNGFWQSYLSFLETPSTLPKNQDIWVKCW